MQGERSACNSSTETIDLNQGSVSSNNGVNQPTGWYSMVHPTDNHSVRSFGGWHIGESSSSTGSNPRSVGPGGNLKTENSFGSPSESEARIGGQLEPSNIILRESVNRPLSFQDSGSTRMPLNLNLNAEHLSNGSEAGRGPVRLLTTDTFPYHIGSSGNPRYLANDDGGLSSLGEWGSSFKRKALDVGSSNCIQQAETFDRHDSHAFHSASSSLSTSPALVNSSSFSHSEELSLRIGIGRELTSEVFPPIGVREAGESSSRNNGVRINQGSHDFDRFNLPSRNSVRESDFYIHHQSSRPISPSDSFEFRSVSSNARTPSQYMHMPSFPWNEAANSGAGGSPSSIMLSVDVGISSPDETSLSSLTRNSNEHSPFSPPSEMRNDWNVSSENARNSASPLNTDWNTPQHGSARNFPRSSQFYPWTPFPSVNAEPGNWRVHFPPLRSVPSSSEQTIMSSGVNHSHHTPFLRSSMLELPGDDASGWHALAAGIEGRQRLVSEIRHVLNAMRRGENLRDEDYMLFDPFINGIAEFHDRHRDMRLDVDNMSYEELLALEERIGDVNTGLTEEAIIKSMQQRKHLYGSSNLEPCSICREEYVLGDDIGKLDCGHDFHTDCIKQWLSQKNLCPICKMTALGT